MHFLNYKAAHKVFVSYIGHISHTKAKRTETKNTLALVEIRIQSSTIISQTSKWQNKLHNIY